MLYLNLFLRPYTKIFKYSGPKATNLIRAIVSTSMESPKGQRHGYKKCMDFGRTMDHDSRRV